MKRLLALLLALLLCGAGAALAAAENELPSGETPPDEVLSHISRKWADYTLEDYVTVQGDTTYGFALLSHYGRRELVGYREADETMEYFLKSQGAVPQGKGEAEFAGAEKDGGTEKVGGGSQAFSVQLTPTEGDKSLVCYRMMEDGRFHMTMYLSNANKKTYTVYPEEDKVVFYDEKGEEKIGTAYGVLQTDIAYTSLGNMPKTLQHAHETMSSAPQLPVNVFEPKEIKFAGGKKYDVYTGPGEAFARSGNGKGSVSTNDWIQVFGRLGNWIMIQYDISSDHFRIGWIKASALPKGAEVKEFNSSFEYYALESSYNNQVLVTCSLTDDPFNSKTELAELPVGTQVSEIVYNYNGWSYIRVTINGATMLGFVPSHCIDHG